MATNEQLARFITEVVLTSHYLVEPASAADQNITDAEMRCLKVIAEHEPIGMNRIAEIMGASKPRITQLVALLEAQSLVVRQVASDRRRIGVRTSAKGNLAIKRLEKRYKALAQAIEDSLGTDQAEELARLLGLITPLSKVMPAER